MAIWNKRHPHLHEVRDDDATRPPNSTSLTTALDPAEVRRKLLPQEARTELNVMEACLSALQTLPDTDRRGFVLTWLAKHSDCTFTIGGD